MVASIVWRINKYLMDWAIDITLDSIKFMFTSMQFLDDFTLLTWLAPVYALIEWQIVQYYWNIRFEWIEIAGMFEHWKIDSLFIFC